jgi:hypothetical protein
MFAKCKKCESSEWVELRRNGSLYQCRCCNCLAEGATKASRHDAEAAWAESQEKDWLIEDAVVIESEQRVPATREELAHNLLRLANMNADDQAMFLAIWCVDNMKLNYQPDLEARVSKLEQQVYGAEPCPAT